MSQSIDVSGLSPEAVRVVESLVVMLRERAEPGAASASIFDLIGKAATPRSGADIARQIEEEHGAWGEP